MSECSESVVSRSLLESIKFPPSPLTKKRIKENFWLGMGEWKDDGDCQPLKKWLKSSTGESSLRFPKPTTQIEGIDSEEYPKEWQMGFNNIHGMDGAEEQACWNVTIVLRVYLELKMPIV